MRTSVIALAFCIGAITLGAACPDRSGQSESAADARVGPAPDSFRVDFETSRGKFSVDVVRSWAPKGADRFYDLVQDHFFDGAKFFRVVPGFVVQFGLNADPKRNERWLDQRIADDPVSHSNLRGTLTFATEGPNTRAHQLFINLVDNARLDRMGFAPIGRVVGRNDRRGFALQRIRRGAGSAYDPNARQFIPRADVPEAGLHQDGADRGEAVIARHG